MSKISLASRDWKRCVRQTVAVVYVLALPLAATPARAAIIDFDDPSRIEGHEGGPDDFHVWVEDGVTIQAGGLINFGEDTEYTCDDSFECHLIGEGPWGPLRFYRADQQDGPPRMSSLRPIRALWLEVFGGPLHIVASTEFLLGPGFAGPLPFAPPVRSLVFDWPRGAEDDPFFSLHYIEVVPEPALLALVAAGLAMAVVGRRLT